MSYTIKISYQALMKKTKLVSPTFSELTTKAENLFPQIKGTKYFIQYLDESDYVLISDDADVETMLAEPSACYKLLISNEPSSGKFAPSDISYLEDPVQILPSKSEEIISAYPLLNSTDSQGIIPVPDDEEVKQDNQTQGLNKETKEKVKLNPEARELVKLAKKITKKEIADEKSKNDFLCQFQAHPEAAKIKPKKRAYLLKAKKSLTPLSQEEEEELKGIIGRLENKKNKKQIGKKVKKELIEDLKNLIGGKNSKDPKDIESKVLSRLQQEPNLLQKKPKLRCEVLKIKKAQITLSEAEETELASLQKKQQQKMEKKQDKQPKTDNTASKPLESIRKPVEKTKKKLDGCKYPVVAKALLQLKKKEKLLNPQIKEKLENIFVLEPLAFSEFPKIRRAFLEYKKNVMSLTAEESAELAAPIKKSSNKQKPSQNIEKFIDQHVNKKLEAIIPKVITQLKNEMAIVPQQTNSDSFDKKVMLQFNGKLIKVINHYPEYPTYNDKLIYYTVMVRNTGKIAWDKNCFIGTYESHPYPLPGLKVGEDSIVTFPVTNRVCPEYDTSVTFFRDSEVFGEQFTVKIKNIVPKGNKIQPEIKNSFPAEIEKKSDQLISLFNTNKQKTLEYVEKNSLIQIEEIIDRLMSNPEEMKRLL